MASSSSSSPSSTSVPPPMKREKPRNWAEMPPELLSSILLRLSVTEILDKAQRVCRSWRRVCKDPLMWRKIDMRNSETMDYDFEAICRHAVDRSQGGLLEIRIEGFGSDSLLTYIADSNLRSLALRPIRLVQAVAKLPLLEELEVSQSWRKLNLKAIGHSCPLLKTLKLNCLVYRRSARNLDIDALAIAESIPKLRHLQLFGNCLTDVGVNVILDKCPHLEDLDLRKCFNVNFVGNLEKRCSERIKSLRRPDDSIADPDDAVDILYSGGTDKEDSD
ncbi:unnamed protein product [Arabis nemorensis]|uniref:F-box domain-containing protein n=1 Tax=Arabis nemorensis TaxID=586526 RepID=A0A565C0L8_9BRAS|nr:unnamed protein product [Arabis nemorensis]